MNLFDYTDAINSWIICCLFLAYLGLNKDGWVWVGGWVCGWVGVWVGGELAGETLANSIELPSKMCSRC